MLRGPRISDMETTANEVVGRNAKEIRDARGMRQIDVAGLLGVSKQTYSKLETGRRGITVDDLLALALVLGVAPSFLLAPWDADAGQLKISLANEDVFLDSEEALDWVTAEQAPVPVVDPTWFYRLAPPAYTKRRDAILRGLEEEGKIRINPDKSVTFMVEHTVSIEFDDGSTAEFRAADITRTEEE